MNKPLQNASNNLEQMVALVIQGVPLESATDGKRWFVNDPYILLTTHGLTYYWRKKPDAFEEVYSKFIRDRGLAALQVPKFDAKYFWDAAMAHKENENDCN